MPSTEYASVASRASTNPAEVITPVKLSRVYSPKIPAVRRLSSRMRWNASKTVHRIGMTTTTTTMTKVGEMRARPGPRVVAARGSAGRCARDPRPARRPAGPGAPPASCAADDRGLGGLLGHDTESWMDRSASAASARPAAGRRPR